MQTGKPPEAVRMPTPGNPEDACRWLEDVIQRSEEAAADLGFLKPWFQDEFWQDNPHYSAGTIRGIKTSFAYAGQVWGHKALRHIRKRDLVAGSSACHDRGQRRRDIGAPAELIMIGKVPCIDLRKAGTKTANASRLIPVIKELDEMGFQDYAARQKQQGLPLVHGMSASGKPRTASAALAGLNRVVHEVFPQEKALLGYSFRHHFRQMLSASGIGLELSRLRTHSQNKTVAARQTAEKKTVGHLS